MSIEEYRQQILTSLLSRTNAKGELSFDESSAKELLNQLSDEELEEAERMLKADLREIYGNNIEISNYHIGVCENGD